MTNFCSSQLRTVDSVQAGAISAVIRCKSSFALHPKQPCLPALLISPFLVLPTFYWDAHLPVRFGLGQVRPVCSGVFNLPALVSARPMVLLPRVTPPPAFVPHSQELGTGGDTICQAGCAMSSVAMLLTTRGRGYNPGTLNSWLKGNGGYTQGDLMYVSAWLSACPFPLRRLVAPRSSWIDPINFSRPSD